MVRQALAAVDQLEQAKRTAAKKLASGLDGEVVRLTAKTRQAWPGRGEGVPSGTDALFARRRAVGVALDGRAHWLANKPIRMIERAPIGSDEQDREPRPGNLAPARSGLRKQAAEVRP
jgi:hypothetical protein